MAALTKGLRTKQEKYSFKYDYHITDRVKRPEY